MKAPRLTPAVEHDGKFGNACPDLWPRKASSCERQRQPSGLAVAGLTGTETILVLNPVAAARKAVVECMRKFGYRVLQAGGAIEAQRRVKVRPDINLLLMDLYGLQTDDLELAVWFRVMYPSLKVLVASEAVWETNYHLGVPERIAFLPKPFTAYELARVVRATLD